MKLHILAALPAALSVVQGSVVKRVTGPLGIDVSSEQPNVDWIAVAASGISFAYSKATEGTSYLNPEFSSQYTGAAKVGLIRGAIHSAVPNVSTGAAQATYFLANGGTWSAADNITLPGALAINNLNGPNRCYNLSASEIVSWIQDFSNTYQKATKRYPVICTTTDWWQTCTGNSAALSKNNSLWIASYNSSIGPLPAGWSNTSFWQYNNTATPNPGNADVWTGDMSGLQHFAHGG